MGSVGTQCSVIYLEGKDRNDPLFLCCTAGTNSGCQRYLMR
ncbi:hypothetical protein [Chlorogloeopsis sp. ULAP02]